MIAIVVGSCVFDDQFPLENTEDNVATCQKRRELQTAKIPHSGDFCKGYQAAADGHDEQAPSFGQLWGEFTAVGFA
jgi:hypothetical protein